MSRFEIEGIESAVDVALVDAWLWVRREVRDAEAGVLLARRTLAREEVRLADARRRYAELDAELESRGLVEDAVRIDAVRIDAERTATECDRSDGVSG